MLDLVQAMIEEEVAVGTVEVVGEVKVVMITVIMEVITKINIIVTCLQKNY